jgi:HAD superfamily hydrolase (TIGR01459 family)
LSITRLDRFAAIAGNYDLILSDVWGVVHNGAHAWPEACAALARVRAAGGTVILISNAPRPGPVVVRKTLDPLGVPADCYDAIVTSGDVTRDLLAARPGARVYHLGPDRDLPIYEGLPVERVPFVDGELVVCSGPFDDENDRVSDYTWMFDEMLARGMPLICANPDLVVERGEQLVMCAGTLADAYRDRGGETIYAGKPFAPVYAACAARARALRGADLAPARTLAIGDALRTDVSGAAREGIDCLFVTSGIHAGDFGPREDPDMDLVHAFFADGPAPRYATPALVW